MKMAQAIQNLGHEVRVLVPDPGGGRITNWDDLARHYGLRKKFEVQWLPVKPRFRGYDYGLKVVQDFRSWGADILYTRLPQAAALASSLKIPTIFEVHDLPGGVMAPWLYRRFLRGKGAYRLIIITHALREAIHEGVISIPDHPFTLIAPDGVDLVRYEKLPNPGDARASLSSGELTQLSVDQFTIGYTGHLYPGRGAQHILDIAENLPEFTFLVVGGDPPAVDDLGRKVDQRGLSNVILTGFVPNTDLPLYQAACDVLLMPYQQKVAASSGGNIADYLSPMKLFEYLACGRPILSSDLPVLREVLNDGNAILLPPDNIGAWVKAIKEIEADLPRRQALQVQARQKSVLYTWEARAAKIFPING
jgi:glycosyltransferase involved in cell wall biosynthesis